MRFHSLPRPLVQLITAFLLTPTFTSAAPPLQAGVRFAELFERQYCAGQACGWNGQVCCAAGSACYTDANNQAQCSSTAGGVAAQATTAVAGGYYQEYTTIYTLTDLETVTSVMSSWVGAATVAPAASTAAQCNYALNEVQCGSICCASNQYCFSQEQSQCSAIGNGGSSGYYSSYYSSTAGATGVAGIPLRPTSSALTVVTTTAQPTTTITTSFNPPVATGANVTLTSAQADNGGGLSGGAIAGIVIGVLLGLLLLGLICFYCCLKGLLDGCLALFGIGGRKKRRTVEVEEYERHSHHHSGAGAGRTWYGASRPARVERRDEKRHDGRNAAGILAGLGGLWAVLGLKRRHDKKKQEKYGSEYSYSYDSEYTSASK